MQEHRDDMTETRGSLEENPSLWTAIRGCLCPCLTNKPPPHQVAKKGADNKATEKTGSTTIKGYNLARPQQGAPHRKGSEDAETEGKREGLLDKRGKRVRQEIQLGLTMHGAVGGCDAQTTCSVCTYPEGQLVSIGINESHLLARIQRVDLQPNLACVKRELTQSPKRKKDLKETFTSPEFQRFWSQRYFIFEKFDEGVKLDEGAWNTTPPEQISEFIAGKCAGGKVILDAFAGAGGTAIKLAGVSSCSKVISNDWNGSRLTCLLNNAKVYEVERNIQISEQDFLAVEWKGVDIVFAQPPFNRQAGARCLSIVDFEPTLNKVLTKCLKAAGDVVLLLPPQTSIEALCSCLNKCAVEGKKMRGSCSIAIDKLYFQGEFKYLLITLGPTVQQAVKLNDELDFIYAALKRKADPTFRHKKVIKRLREDHGMLQILNLLKLSEKRAKDKQDRKEPQEDLMDIFFQTAREKQLITAERLEKLMQEQTPDTKKQLRQSKKEQERPAKDAQGLEAVMQEEKVEEDATAYRQSQQTQSDYSHYSYLSGMDRGHTSYASRLVRLQSDSFSSVIIKRTLNGSRQKRDISPNGSPVTPTRRNGKNRISQVPEKKEVEGKKRARDL